MRTIRKRNKRVRQRRKRIITVVIVAVVLLLLAMCVKTVRNKTISAKDMVERNHLKYDKRPEMDVALLTPNEYSRPGNELKQVKGIVIHYTANPGTTAMQNRDYFEGLKDSHITKASAHLIIGYDGEIVQCIPTAEIAYASNNRNEDTIAIECCHMDETGRFTEETYQSLIRMTAFLMAKFDLTSDDVIRHYDVTGKNCPKFYVEHEEEWLKFKDDLNEFILKNGE